MKLRPILVTNNRYVTWFLTASRNTLIAVLVGVIGAIALIWYFFCYVPLSTDIKTLQKQIVARKSEYAQCAQSVAVAHAAEEKNIEMYKGFLDKCVRPECHAVTDDIVKLARSLRIKCVQVKPIHETKLAVYDKEWYRVTLHGSFKKILTFLDRIHQMPLHLSIERCDLTREERKRVAMNLTICVHKRHYA